MLAAAGIGHKLRRRWSREGARLRRKLARTKLTAIKDAAGGVAKIAGRVGAASSAASPSASLVAPLSGRPCLYWSITVRRYDLEVLHAERGVDFFVRDATGKAFVTVRAADVVASGRVLEDKFDPLDARAERFVDEHGRARNGHYNPARPMTFREVVLAEGDDVSVSGSAEWALDPEPDAACAGGYREPPRRLEIAAREGVPVTIGDPPPAR
jgi:hypothetical protein